MKSAVAGSTIDVRWRGRGLGIVGGIAAGAIVGAAIANANRPYYGEAYPYEAAPVYEDAAPVYVPRYYRNNPYGGCVSNEGYGRTTSCDSR